MRRLIVTALVVLAAVPAVAAGLQVNATVSDVTLSPSEPAPGETVTFGVDIQNFESSGDSLEINAVALRRTSDGSGITEYARVRNVGTLSPGASVRIDLTHAFETAGTKDLRIYVYAENADTGDNVQLRYPVSVTVRERHPQIDVQANDSVAGVATNGSVTVANGLDTALTNVEMNVTGENATMLDGRTVFAGVDEGGTVTAPFRFRASSAGTHQLRATLSYTLPDGTDRTVTQNRTIETEALSEGVVVDATSSGSGAEQRVRVDVFNQGNAVAEDVVVTAVSENATVGQAILSAVEPGSTEQVRLNATLSEPRADVAVTADYETGSNERRVNATTTLRSVPASIELTGLNVVREGGELQITGSTSNVGMTAARSVVVRVVPTAGVEPAAPNRDFFVGEVPASDFSSFDLTARATGNVSSIPVAVSYLVDDTRRTQTFEVAVDGSVGAQPQQPQGGGGPGTGVFLVLGLAVVAVLVVAAILVRRYRSDTADEI
jgi:hypothetical protein